MKKLLAISILLIPFAISAQTKKLKAETNHSTVGFSISIAGFTKVTGKFTDYEILIDWDEKSIHSSTISSTIKVESINTGIADRDKHLLTPDFFDAVKYPEIHFKSDSIIRIDSSHFEGHGKLSMHGITKAFVLPFQIVKIDGNTLGMKSKTTLNRLDYEVGAGFKHTSLPDFLGKTIEVEINLWTTKRKE